METKGENQQGRRERDYWRPYVLSKTPDGNAVEPVSSKSFRLVNIGLPLPIATGLPTSRLLKLRVDSVR